MVTFSRLLLYRSLGLGFTPHLGNRSLLPHDRKTAIKEIVEIELGQATGAVRYPEIGDVLGPFSFKKRAELPMAGNAGRGTHPLIRIVSHGPAMLNACSVEVEAIRAVIAPARAFIDHVGSTSIPGLPGKPVLDLLVSPIAWEDAEKIAGLLAELGYRAESDKDNVRRYFLTKTIGIGSLEAVHLHLTPPHSDWGNNMLAFRDELIADKELANRYTTLRQNLAADHPDDLEAYTLGKTAFVTSVLFSAAGTFSNDRLLTHQRAELGRAQTLQNLVLLSQLCVAGIAALSVYSNDNATLLVLAFAGFIVAGVWLALARRQRFHRNAGDQARRVVLLSSGLGETFSPEQRLRIFDKFEVKIKEHHLTREESYFATRISPSYRRLAEIIEESAYWTRYLQKASAVTLLWALISITLVIAVVILIKAPAISSDANLSMARVLIAFLVFLLSSDIIGAMFAHREAASAIDEIAHRLETAAAHDYPPADMLLIVSDYNAAVESAPSALPGMYKAHGRTLTRRWRVYLQNKRLTTGGEKAE